ncbi:MAG: trypsin-like peptidase domain-containing protein [Gammaproteobacteria bacterium]|nr:trypsin-like peptidase domain-containing protein [Gammaproteobacteria bacterium]
MWDKRGLAKVLKENGSLAGSAFLVTKRHLLTCAHVVSLIYSSDPNLQEQPAVAFKVEFPGADACRARVCCWHPRNPKEPERLSDIAVLEIQGEIPAGCTPVPLFLTAPAPEMDLRNDRICASGFPSDTPTAIASKERGAEGHVVEAQSHEWLQINAEQAFVGHAMQPGLSGGPVWSDESQGIIGMTVEFDNIKGRREGFVIPTHVLAEAWPELLKQGRFVNPFGNTIPPFERHRLKALLRSAGFDKAQWLACFNRVSQGQYRWEPGASVLDTCVDMLGDKRHDAAKAPLLAFLAHVRPLAKQAGQCDLPAVDSWCERVSDRLGLDWAAVQTVPASRLRDFTILLRVENRSRNLTSEKLNLAFFVFLDNKDKALADNELKQLFERILNTHWTSREKQELKVLEQALPVMLIAIVNRLISAWQAREENIHIEIMLPLELFHWDINRALRHQGRLVTTDLAEKYTVTVRIWERVYYNQLADEDGIQTEYEMGFNSWQSRWGEVPEAVRDNQLHPLHQAQDDLQTLYNHLLRHNIAALLLCYPITRNDSPLFEITLLAGVPAALWVVEDTPFADAEAEIKQNFCCCGMTQWPGYLRQMRLATDNAKIPAWKNMILMLDMPKRLPPDIKHQLSAAEETQT